MAEQFGIDTAKYLKTERGEIRLTVERLEKIAMVLGVKVNKIF